jgi:hypothetical protein
MREVSPESLEPRIPEGEALTRLERELEAVVTKVARTWVQ